MEKITVLGGGSWGTALADHLGRCGNKVSMWLREEDVAEGINSKKENEVFLPGFKLSDNLSATTSLEDSLKGCGFILSVIPSQYVRSVMAEAKEYIEDNAFIVSASKGIEQNTYLRCTEVIKEVLGGDRSGAIAVLSGPSFAKEVAKGLPAALSAAGGDHIDAERVQKVFNSKSFRVYVNTDIIGVELGGALKNVIALAAGASDGLELGTNARAALITRGLSEMARLGVKAGAKERTFFGLSGMGDLVLTCTGELSRNRTVGFELGRGRGIDEIISEMKMVAEGVKTSKSAFELSKRYAVEMPITEEVYNVIHEGKPVKDAFRDLMQRDPKDE
ncbi:MAG: NAD(P)-dependent glycerol-3-phosphate dehydrogenase [Deltaproteobacteria bacterium]|nr:NAD(P)-dependent glycerol-3-phosphate dehydrogenase [Deltaproteobacteria bacterium]